MFYALAFLFASSQFVSAAIPDNSVKLEANSVFIELENQADGRALFGTLDRAPEYIMDSGIELKALYVSQDERFQVRCVGSNLFYCSIEFSSKTKQYQPGTDGKTVFFEVDSAISAKFWDLWSKETYAAGHTALKIFKTSDSKVELGCSKHAGEEKTHCWVGVTKQ